MRSFKSIRGNDARSLLVFVKVFRNETASIRNYYCSFHSKVFKVSYFSHGIEIFLANFSKENTRIADEGREGFLWLRV